MVNYFRVLTKEEVRRIEKASTPKRETSKKSALDKFKGKWVAYITSKDKVVAAGDSFDDIKKHVILKGKRIISKDLPDPKERPVAIKVPEKAATYAL